LIREKEIINKNVIKTDEKTKKHMDIVTRIAGSTKKMEMQIEGFKSEATKMARHIYVLEKDKEKYGIEASQANAKYFQCLEEVKLKNNLISELQKKNIEADSKLKQQQNLYETVRSDRNL